MITDINYHYLHRLYKPDPKIFVVTPERIEAALNERSRLRKERIEKSIDMYLKGYSHADIAKEIGVCERQVALWTRSVRAIEKRKLRMARRKKAVRLAKKESK